MEVLCFAGVDHLHCDQVWHANTPEGGREGGREGDERYIERG